MPSLAELNEQIEDFVLDAAVGGDTHRDTHHLEMVSGTGVVIARIVIDNDAEGYAEVVAWIAEHTPGPRVLIGLEGTRSYGIGLCRALQAAGLEVVEVERPKRSQRRKGKSDPIDAHLAAMAVLRMPVDRKVLPRSDGDREALRILLGARRDMTTQKTRQTNRLRALLLTGDDADRALSKGAMSDARLDKISGRPAGPGETVEQLVRRVEATRLATSIRATELALRANKKELTKLVEKIAPHLLEKVGVGPVSAAQMIVSFSHVGRCRNEAAFAALAGVSPLPASSGRTHRHRLNRGGDRQLNRAMHDVAKSRVRYCPRTRDYIAKRQAQGMPDREIRRCLKRYIAREVFRALMAEMG